MRRVALLLIGLVALTSAAAYAHHSYAATYDVSNEIKLEGRLVQFVYRNPHSFVHVEAPDESGELHRWAVEWGGAGQLSGQGVTNQTLRPGDIVTITGNPGRDPKDHRVRMLYLQRKSDGFDWGRRPGETFN